MSRIVIIGNSHLGCMRRAIGQTPEAYPEKDIVLYGVPGGTFSKLVFFPKTSEFGLGAWADRGRAGKLLRQINKSPRIKIEPDDKVVFVGQSQPWTKFAKLLSQRTIDGARRCKSEHRMSSEAYAAIEDELIGSFIKKPFWTALPSNDVFFSVSPIPSETCLDVAEDDSPNRFWRHLAETPEGAKALIDQFVEKFAAETQKVGVTYINQPDDTRAKSGLTDRQFNKRSNAKSPDAAIDYLHMNSKFGHLALQNIMRAIKS